MKKILLSIFILMVISVVACQQAAKTETKPVATATTPTTTATGDAAVDAVGNDLTNVDSVDKELSSDELSDLDSGLTDVQNI